jgi:hypothetical protein
MGPGFESQGAHESKEKTMITDRTIVSALVIVAVCLSGFILQMWMIRNHRKNIKRLIEETLQRNGQENL